MIIKVQKNVIYLSLFIVIVVVATIVTVVLNPGESADSLEKDKNLGNGVQLENVIENGSSNQQTASMGAVTIDVEPKQLGEANSNSIFSVAFNTHSVELDFDFTKIISLQDDLGKNYQALEWTGNSGWHHVSGDIIFPPLDEKANKVTMSIIDIENTTSSFKWDVEK